MVEEAVTVVVRLLLTPYHCHGRYLTDVGFAFESRLLCAVPFSAGIKSATLAPKVEIYTQLACRVHKPDIYDSQTWDAGDAFSKALTPRAEVGRSVESDLSFPWAPIIRSNNSPLVGTPEDPRPVVLAGRATGKKPASPCAADPTVQAAVARLSAGEYLCVV